MRVGLYNRYWTTMGGGEMFAAAITRALLDQGHAVELIGFERVDRTLMYERLGISTDVPMVLSGAEHEVSLRSQVYDLFVNATYLSSAVNLAPCGVFVVHFPGSMPNRYAKVRERAGDAWRQRSGTPRLRWAEGMHAPENGGEVAWTNGLARLLVELPDQGEVRFKLSSRHWPHGARVDITVKVGTSIVHRGVLEPDLPVEIVVPHALQSPDRPVPVLIASDSFVPAATFGTADARQLGVQVTDLCVGGERWALTPTVPVRGAAARAYLDTYDRLVANSRYTARWIDELWERSCEVLHPPVRQRNPRTRRPKEAMILAVGRFFGASRGHSKKQIELVRAFRSLLERGVTGWSLHLAGGCSPDDRAYAMAVKREAHGLPVSVYLNASQPRMDDLYARSALFWHAAGYGERPERNPDRFEHFGVSVAEALAAGCVPLVYAFGGPSEIVADIPSARRWRSLTELVGTTVELIAAHDRGDLVPPPPLHHMLTFEQFSGRVAELAGAP